MHQNREAFEPEGLGFEFELPADNKVSFDSAAQRH
jgi:hypothetical protein